MGVGTSPTAAAAAAQPPAVAIARVPPSHQSPDAATYESVATTAAAAAAAGAAAGAAPGFPFLTFVCVELSVYVKQMRSCTVHGAARNSVVVCGRALVRWSQRAWPVLMSWITCERNHQCSKRSAVQAYAHLMRVHIAFGRVSRS
jgi:hypothetical protein